MLNLENISTEKFPAKKEFLICSNGSFTISENGIVRFTYLKKPNKELIASENANLEELNNELQEAIKSKVDMYELRSIRSKIASKEKFIETISKEMVPAQYECRGLDNEVAFKTFQELAKKAKSNNVWSVAYATGLRFEEEECPNEDIEFNDPDGMLITYREWHYTGKKSLREAE